MSLTGVWPFKAALTLLLLLGIMLPSAGDHGLLSPKSLSFLAVAASWLLYLLFHPRLSSGGQKILLFFIASVGMLTLWLLFGASNEELAFAQFKVFCITLFVATSLLFALEEKIFTYPQLLKLVIGANFAYSLIKVVLVTLHMLQVIDLFSLMEGLGIRFMSMGIIGQLGRLQTSVDIITPFVLYFMLTSRSWGLTLPRLFRSSFTLLAWLSIGLSFSRFLLLCAFLAHAAYWLTENRKELALSLFKCVTLTTLFVLAAGPSNVAGVIEKRFFSEDNSHSDDLRGDQIEAMMVEFQKSPYLGRGMGGYSPTFVRDPVLKYSYEVQWVSFLMQFGLIGLPLLLFPILLAALAMLSSPLNRARFSLFLMFATWILSGFTNPFLISLTSGIVYALFYGAQRVNYDITIAHERVL